MMSSAFECFDPYIFGMEGQYLIWGLPLMGIFSLSFTSNFSYLNSSFMGLKEMSGLLLKVLSDMPSSAISGLKLLLVSTFFSVLMLNLTGVLPYVFSITSHIIFTYFLGLPLWVLYQFKGMKDNFLVKVSSFILTGCSKPLILLLSGVELISLLIQPLTLSVRLMANLSAGHLVLSLVGSLCVWGILSSSSSIFFFIFFIVYYFFEVAVNFVQSYIFFLLVSSYGSLNVSISYSS